MSGIGLMYFLEKHVLCALFTLHLQGVLLGISFVFTVFRDNIEKKIKYGELNFLN